MHNYAQMTIWMKAMELAKSIYQTTKYFPQEEVYGLVSQMRRAAVSIPSNIAEGSGRNTNKEFTHFLSIALGSLFELNTQVILAENIGFISQVQSEELQSQTLHLQKNGL